MSGPLQRELPTTSRPARMIQDLTFSTLGPSKEAPAPTVSARPTTVPAAALSQRASAASTRSRTSSPMRTSRCGTASGRPPTPPVSSVTTSEQPGTMGRTRLRRRWCGTFLTLSLSIRTRRDPVRSRSLFIGLSIGSTRMGRRHRLGSSLPGGRYVSTPISDRFPCRGFRV
jgi:hypothetical protein